MIQILVVEDNLSKQARIRELILDCTNIKSSDLIVVGSIKDAKVHLYKTSFDLMILDLVLPIEIGLDADAKHGAQFLTEIEVNPSIKPPIHIVGLTGFHDKVTEYQEHFKKNLWNLVDYSPESDAWQEQLRSIIYHLVRTRQRFIQSAVRRNSFDIAIITALNEPELQAVLNLGSLNWERVEVENDFIKFYKTTFSNGSKSRSVIAASADQMGMTASSHLATKMILYFKPAYMIMAGIAAGVKSRDLGFGDILIAEQSWDYESGKIVEIAPDDANEESKVEFRPDPKDIQLSPDLKAKVANFQITGLSVISSIQDEWKGKGPSTKLKMHLGQIGSGASVLSSPTKLSDISRQKRKLLGVDMETYGLYYAAERSPEPRTKAISIKSVSDYGDGQKNDEYQKYAAYTSASFIYRFILSEL